MRLIFTFWLLAFLFAFDLAAREIHVSTFSQLKTACQTARPGDTITVAPGTYTITGVDRIWIVNRPGPVLVRGKTGNPRDVVIQGKGQDNSSVWVVFNLDYSPRWTFKDLTTRRTYYHGFKFDHTSTDCVLKNIIMLDHGESGVKGTCDPASGVYPDRLTVDGCEIGFTSPDGGTRTVVEGVDGVGVNDWIIRNCRFINVQRGGKPAFGVFTKGNSSNTIIESNRFENCFIGASFGGGGTAPQYFRDNNRAYEHSNGVIRNNIIIGCPDAGIYINKGRNAKVYNNTIFECVLTIQLRFPQSTGDVRNNLVKRAPSNPYEPIVRLRDGATFIKNKANLAASDADFVKPGGPQSQKDLHLVSGSAAVDAGVNLGSLVPVDFEGQPRPAGNAYDVGADELGVVPVELLSFTAGESPGEIALRWITASETGNYGFEIQRKRGPGPFTAIGFVPGNGTTVDRHAYAFRDKVPFPRASRLAYRLRQIDFDGSEHFYPVVELPVVPGSRPRMDALYPNPAAESVVDAVTVPVYSPEKFSLSVYDALGRRMLFPVAPAYDPGSWSIRLPVSALPAGTYIVVLESASKKLSRTFSVTAP